TRAPVAEMEQSDDAARQAVEASAHAAERCDVEPGVGEEGVQVGSAVTGPDMALRPRDVVNRLESEALDERRRRVQVRRRDHTKPAGHENAANLLEGAAVVL